MKQNTRPIDESSYDDFEDLGPRGKQRKIC